MLYECNGSAICIYNVINTSSTACLIDGDGLILPDESSGLVFGVCVAVVLTD